MRIAGLYSFKNGEEAIRGKYPDLMLEVEDIIQSVDALAHKTKQSKEKTMRGQMLYNPIAMNKAFAIAFKSRGWEKKRIPCKYTDRYYTRGYAPPQLRDGAFREMDFVKRKLGIEVQFGKYAFMVYNVCAKMTIFARYGLTDIGIEIIPMKGLQDHMSTGVSYFEQVVWDLEARGVADIDVPVLIIGIDV